MNLITKIKQPVAVVEILQNMIKPTEVVKRVTQKTIVTTDEAIHSIWQTTDKYGRAAIFTSSKKLKSN